MYSPHGVGEHERQSRYHNEVTLSLNPLLIVDFLIVE